MADNKQEKPNGKEEKAPKTGIIPRAAKSTWSTVRHPIETGKKIGKWAWSGDGTQRNAARDAVQHHANDDEVIKQMSAGQTEEGEAQKPKMSATTADQESGSSDSFREVLAWLNDSIINGAPKMPGGVQEPIWGMLEEKALIDAIENPPKDKHDEQPTRSPEEKANTDLKYQATMLDVRKKLAEKLREKNVVELSSDETDIIFCTMLYLTEEVKEEGIVVGEQYKYRDRFYELVLDGSKMVAPGNEGKIIGDVLNYLAKHKTTYKSQEGLKAIDNIADQTVAQQFFMKYSYPEREKLAKAFYEALSPLPEEKKEKYRAVLLQELRKDTQQLESFKNYFEGLEKGQETGVPKMAENFKKEYNSVLAKVIEVISKELVIGENEYIDKNKLKDKKETGDKLKSRLKSDSTIQRSIDKNTLSNIEGLIDLTYEIAKQQNEINEFEYNFAKNPPGSEDAIAAANYKLDKMIKKINEDKNVLTKLKNELVLRSFPVLKVAYTLINKNLYNTEGPANIKMSQYIMAPVYYSGGRKEVYEKLFIKPENWLVRFFKRITKLPVFGLEILKWEDGERKLFESKKPLDVMEEAVRTDWLERLRLKIPEIVRKNWLFKSIASPFFFFTRGAHAAGVVALAVPYYLLAWPNMKLGEWHKKNQDKPGHKIYEKLDPQKHIKDRKPLRAITTQSVLNGLKATLRVGIIAAYIIGIPYGWGYIKTGFGYVGRGIATVWNNMTSGRIAFYDSLKERKMKEMKAGMQSEIKRAKTSKGNFVSEYFRYELEENLKSRDHYASAYYSEPLGRWLARTYYGNSDADRISDKDIEVLAKMTYGDADGTEKQKEWLKEYTDKVKVGSGYSLPVVGFTKDETNGTYSMGINATAAHEKKKQRLEKQLAWLEKHPEVVKFLEEAHSLANVETVTNEDFNIKIDSAKEGQWRNAGWKGPETKVLPKINNKGETVKDKEGKVIMEERHIYYRKGYMGAKKDGIKLNPHKTEELVAELMKQKEPMTYLKENMLDLIDNDYFIAAEVARCMGNYGVNLENAKFLMSNPHVMAWLQPMLEEGHAVYYVKRDRSNDMVELVKSKGGVKGIVQTVELKPEVIAKVIETAEMKEILEDKTSVFGAYCARLTLQEQLKEYYPNADNAFYLIQNEITTHANKNGYEIKAGEEKKLAWRVLWEIGRENADIWKKALGAADKEKAYQDVIKKSTVTNALFPTSETPSANVYESKRKEILSKVLKYATSEGLVKAEIPEYAPSVSVRELMLDYMGVGGYNIVEGRADDFIKKAREHMETGGEIEDLKQPFGIAVPQLAMYGIIWIPTDEASAAGAGVPNYTISMALMKYGTADIKTNLLDAYLPNNNLYEKLSGKYDGEKIKAEVAALVDKKISEYQQVVLYRGEDSEEAKIKADGMKRDIGITVLTEEMKNKDLKKPEEEQLYAEKNVGDMVIVDGAKLANWAMTQDSMQKKFPLDTEDDKKESKKTEDQPKADKPKKKKAKKKKQDDAGGPPPVTFSG